MKLSKPERDKLRLKFDGKCAYCGCELSNKWHADHLEPVLRDFDYVRGKGFVLNGKILRPQYDTIENIMPSCPPCNIDKHSMKLEDWRRKLQDSANVLKRNNPTYRHALRYGLISENDVKIQFYFEKYETLIHQAQK